MNQVYRTVYNHSLGLWQVVSEFTRLRGKTSGARKGGASGRRRTLGAVLALPIAVGTWANEVIEDDAVTVDGSVWDVEGDLHVGVDGEGSLVIINGGRVSNAAGVASRIGQNATGSGEVTVTGSGSVWTNTGSLAVGYEGTGTLRIEDGGRISSDEDSTIGSQQGGSGTAVVSGAGSLWTSARDFTVGYYSDGSLTIENGGEVRNGNGFVGAYELIVEDLYNTTGTGTVTVTGTDSTWTNTGYLSVGFYGDGTLNIENGGTVTSNNAYIGFLPGSEGSVTVSGTGSTWTDTGDNVVIGDGGRARLLVENGGQVSSRAGYVGVEVGSPGADGTATITGAGSAWTNTGNLFVGGGTGEFNIDANLNIEDGGTVSSADGHIGHGGTVTVTGSGSTWTNTGELDIGYKGLVLLDGERNSGTLNIGAYDGSGTAGTVTATRITTSVGSGRVNFNQTDDVSFDVPIDGIIHINQRGSGTTRLTGSVDLDTRIIYPFPEADPGFRVVLGGRLNVSNGTLAVDGGSLSADRAYLSGGALDVLNGGSFTSGNTFLGSPGHATATVSGAGSEWTMSGDLRVGQDHGNGTLFIEGGGVVNSGARAIIGLDPYGTGEVTVTDAGSTWAVSGDLIVSYDEVNTAIVSDPDGDGVSHLNSVPDAGAGALTVQNGGSVTSNAMFIGRGPNNSEWSFVTATVANGVATVTGTGSSLTVAGDLVVAHNGGSGTLNIGAEDLSDTAGTITAARITTLMDEVSFVPPDSGWVPEPVAPLPGTGIVNFNQIDDITFDVPMEGALEVNQRGSGSTTLIGANTYTGATTVSGGTLRVNGSIANSAVTVEAGATLGGNGTVGATTVLDGGTLAAGNSIGTLTVDGDLSLSSASILDFELGSPGASAAAPGNSDRIAVSGDLAFNGTLNLSPSDDLADGTAGLGYYRLMTYGGNLISNTAVIGSTPALGADIYDLQVGEGQVDLFVAATGDDVLQHWQGGDGLWDTGSSQWLNQGGTVPVEWAGRHAIFKDANGHSGGTIAVEGSQSFQGLQFVDAGYQLEGTGQLVTDDAGREIRVLANSATISTEITGSGGIVKTEAGTLTLTGDNSYTGGTVVNGGTLALAGTGSMAGSDSLVLNNGSFNISALSAAGITLGSLSGASGTSVMLGGKTLGVDQAHDSVFAGAIHGSGGLRKEGTATLTLNGNSTYSGATTVGGGMLVVDGSIADSTVSVQSGATLGGSGTVGGTAVLDGGTLAPGSSLGTLTVNGDLALSSGSSLDFELGSPGAAADTPGNSDRIVVTGDLALNGTLNLSQSDDPADGTSGRGYYRLMTYGGELTSNTAAVGTVPGLEDPTLYELQAGDGQVDLFVAGLGDDSLQHWQGGDGVWNSTDSKWLNRDGDAPANWAGQHAIFKDANGHSGGTVSVEGTQSFRGLQFVDEGYRLEGAGQLVTNDAGSEVRVLADSATIATAITGTGGIVKTEAGTLVLEADSSYTGTTTVAGGALVVNGSIANSAVVVQAGASLGGSGTMGSLQVSDGAVLAPGNSIGSLTLSGDLSFAGDSVYEVEVDPRSDGSDHIQVGGVASLNDAAVRHIGESGTYQPFSSYTILTADGGIDGEFGEVTSAFAFLDPALSYDSNNVYLELQRNDVAFAEHARSGNQRTTAASLESLERDALLYQQTVMLDAASAPAAFDSLSGDSLLANVNTGRELQRRFGTELRRQSAMLGLTSGDLTAGARQSDSVTTWVQAQSSEFEEGDERAIGNAEYRSRSESLAVGAEISNEQWLLGAAVSTADASLSYHNRDADGNMDAYFLGTYGRWQGKGGLYLRGDLSYGRMDAETERSIDQHRLVADTKLNGSRLALETGVQMSWYGLILSPYVQASGEWFKREGFREDGGSGAELEVDSERFDSGELSLGLDLSKPFHTDKLQGRIRAGIAAVDPFGDTRASQSARFQAGGESFTVYSADLDGSHAEFTLSSELLIKQGLSVWAGYRGRVGQTGELHDAQLGLAYRW